MAVVVSLAGQRRVDSASEDMVAKGRLVQVAAVESCCDVDSDRRDTDTDSWEDRTADHILVEADDLHMLSGRSTPEVEEAPHPPLRASAIVPECFRPY